MTLRYYGSLKNRVTGPENFQPEAPVSVKELIRSLDIPISAIKLVMVNHSPVHPESMIQPNDSVALFPREYPFFADWKDYWWKS